MPPLSGTETILLVDDEAFVRPVLATVLRQRGYSVLEAAGVEEALSLVESHPALIHLLVTDIAMPIMTGYQLAEQLRARCPDLKVLFISGTASELSEGGELVTRAGDFLKKPFLPVTLAEKVREVLDR